MFASSIFPYAAFLYYLTQSKKTPGKALFGFYFLLVFVFATIPAGIYGTPTPLHAQVRLHLAPAWHCLWGCNLCWIVIIMIVIFEPCVFGYFKQKVCVISVNAAAKVKYGTILANVDWLHGSAESMLTITNLLIGEAAHFFPCL